MKHIRARYNMVKWSLVGWRARRRLKATKRTGKFKLWLGQKLFWFFETGYFWSLKYGCTLEGINREMTPEDRERVIARIQQIFADREIEYQAWRRTG